MAPRDRAPRTLTYPDVVVIPATHPAATHPVDDDPNPWRPSAARGPGAIVLVAVATTTFVAVNMYSIVDISLACRSMAIAADRAVYYDVTTAAVTVVLLTLHPLVALVCGHHHRSRR